MKMDPRESGFSLIEFLVSVAVLTVAGAGLFLIATTATTSNTEARDQIAAVQLGVDKIEELKNTAFADLSSGADPTPITAGGASDGLYTRSWTASSRTVAGIPAKDMTVTVAWSGGGSIALTTTIVHPNTIVPGFMEEFPTVSVRSWEQTR